MGKRRKVQLAIPIVASTKKTLGESRKPKEALLYPSDRIWRRIESIGTSRSIDRRLQTSIPITALEDGGSIKLSILVGERTS